jgi:hypothetical protein
LELHKNWIPLDLIEQAREEVLANTEMFNRKPEYAHQQRIELDGLDSPTIKKIADLCEALTWHPWRPKKSGAQVHGPKSFETTSQSWHQDIVALDGPVGCTVWIPLDPIDGTRPSLRFGGEHPALQHHIDQRQFSYVPDIEVDVYSILNRADLGTVVMFSWSELHGTYWDSNMTNGRISLDLRFTPNT